MQTGKAVSKPISNLNVFQSEILNRIRKILKIFVLKISLKNFNFCFEKKYFIKIEFRSKFLNCKKTPTP